MTTELHTNANTLQIRRPRPLQDVREATLSAPAEADLSLAVLFGTFAYEATANGSKGVELRTYQPHRCAPLVLSPAPSHLVDAACAALAGEWVSL